MAFLTASCLVAVREVRLNPLDLAPEIAFPDAF
jgi:hypothetical protein